MKQPWKALFWAGTTAAYWYAGWLGVHGEHHPGNVFKFAVWLFTVLSALFLMGVCNGETREKNRKSLSPSVPRWLAAFSDIAGVFMLAYFGWFGYATLVFLQMILEQAAWDKLKETEPGFGVAA